MSTRQAQESLHYVRVAWQSALVAGLCLGIPAGLLLWLILFQRVIHSALIERAVAFLQANGLNKIFLLAVCSLAWSFLLARISGYRPWWKLGIGAALAIFVSWLSPLSNLDGWFGDRLPVHTLYAVAMSGMVTSTTICVGLAYGLILRSARAALALALMTSLVSVSGLVLTIALFDQFGIRVGTGNFAMSKVTVASLLVSAVLGGMVLGVGFSRLAREEK